MDKKKTAKKYDDRIAAAILSCSENKEDVQAAFQEWQYPRGDYTSYRPKANQDCELCGYKGIVYQFVIVNKFNGNRLIVGRECIRKFAIPAVLYGRTLDEKETARQLAEDVKFMQTGEEKTPINPNVIDALIRLAEFDDTGMAELIRLYKRKRAFLPDTLLNVLGLLEFCGIPYNDSDFKLDLGIAGFRELTNLSNEQLDNLKAFIPEDLYLGILKRRGR